MSRIDKNVRAEFTTVWARGIWEFETNDLPVIGPHCCVFVEVPHAWFIEREVEPIGTRILDKLAWRVGFMQFLEYIAFGEA